MIQQNTIKISFFLFDVYLGLPPTVGTYPASMTSEIIVWGRYRCHNQS